MQASEPVSEHNDGWPPDACTLDHDGCVVCSDAGIPLRVVGIEGDDAVCRDAAGNEAVIAVELVAPVQPGEFLLTHGGVAIGRVSREREGQGK
ncbi:MAG: HypC/HybG/HupF family hydrogenase formation chaperone [Chloroflexota bacterium]|nr:MAG: hydrogenase maturation protein [Chloroflexota bacterium]